MTDTTTALDLGAIRQRLDKATPGPWNAHPDGLVWSTLIGDPVSGSVLVADAGFIAAARTDIRDLLAEVDRLRAARTPHPAIWDETRDAMRRARNLADDYEVTGDVETARRIRQALHIPDLHELLAAAEEPTADREQDADKTEPTAEKNLNDAAAAVTR